MMTDQYLIIDFPSMKILLSLALLLICACNEVCLEPQRSFYMSYPALSKRDALNRLFEEITQKMTVLQNKYTDHNLQATFELTDMKMGVYYNDHHQKEEYVNKYEVNVTNGILQAGGVVNFKISYQNKTKKGTVLARVTFDPSYFTKKLQTIEGFLEWNPDLVPPLSLTQLFRLDRAYPELSQKERSTILAMLNNQAGATRVKEHIVEEVNANYAPFLKKHLNHEELVGTTNITYEYNHISIKLDNVAKDFGVTNEKTKGLEVFFIFGLENSTENCTELPKEFDEAQYGGFQEFYTFSTIRALLKEGAKQGLFDVTLDTTWEVPGFQFYMGDLGNSVEHANHFPAGEPFEVSCELNKEQMQNRLTISRFHERDLYLNVPEICHIKYKGNVIIDVSFEFTMTLQLEGQGKTIDVLVTNTGVFSANYESKDINYQVTSHYLANYSLDEVLAGLRGKKVFGSNFPIVNRRFPAIRVFDDRLLIFDPSEK